MKNNVFKKGFTLIELMIVIVILGVLMGTILPRLTGAQSSARDTGRKADLHSIAQALETYYDYNSKYPGTGGVVCLDGANAESIAIGEFLKGGVPTPPSAKQVTKLPSAPAGNCEGAYAYAPLTSRGLPNNGYILATDVEVYQNANLNLGTGGGAPSAITGATKSEAFTLVDGTTLKDADSGTSGVATNTIFVVIR